ncbi:hypothetical protein EYZ11_000039 [Aspergillus tanneri]|uniref:Uncharacterized protein n=1 Tax=Aspergillus tanneri TaxID=1220188 RepID=A0A4S3JY36_9EURO|nr:hypothetical protein EYZ11_000039 [Aspergillus tanneri]
MPPSALHNPPYPPVAERLIRPEGAFLHRAFQLSLEALYQPVDFQMNSSVNKGIEVVAEGVGFFTQGKCRHGQELVERNNTPNMTAMRMNRNATRKAPGPEPLERNSVALI